MQSSKLQEGNAVGWILGVLALLVIGAAALYLIDVDQTKEARLPEVELKGGQMPEFDVDVADVEVGSKEVVVEVPALDVETETVEIEVPSDVDVESESVEFSVPTIEVEPPAEDDPADNGS